MSINYLLDENLPPLYKVQLLRRHPYLIVWMIGEPGVPPTGTLPDFSEYVVTKNLSKEANSNQESA